MVLETVIKYGKIAFEASKNFILRYGKMLVDAIKTVGIAKIIKGTIEVVGIATTVIPFIKKTSRAAKYKAKHSMDISLEMGASNTRTPVQKNVIKKIAKSAFKKNNMDSIDYENEIKKLDSRITKAQTDKFESLCSDNLTKYDLESNYAKFLRENNIPEPRIRELLLKDKMAIKERKLRDKTEEIMDRHFFGDDVFEDDYEGINPETNPILLAAANKYYKGEKLDRFEKFCFNEYLNNYGKKLYNEERREMNMRAASAF